METIKLADRGILLFDIKAETMQRFWKHEVPDARENVGERINLEYRKIVKG